MDWATYLKRLRRGRGVSQAEFASLLGVSQTTVWRWETGQAVPTPSIYDRLRSLSAIGASDADRAAIHSARSSRGIVALIGPDTDRYLTVSLGVCALQAAPHDVLTSVARSRSASEEANRIMADGALIRALFAGEVAALRVTGMVPSYHGGPRFGLETIWTPWVFSDGTRVIRNDARRAPVPIRPGIEVLTFNDLTDGGPVRETAG